MTRRLKIWWAQLNRYRSRDHILIGHCAHCNQRTVTLPSAPGWRDEERCEPCGIDWAYAFQQVCASPTTRLKETPA